MKKQFMFLLALCLTMSQIYAQKFDKKQNDVGLTVSAGSGSVISASYQQLIGLGSSKRFRIGYGLRFSAVSGKHLDTETAPYKIRKVESQIDVLHLPKFNSNSLNAAIHLQYSLNQKIDVGFNIDALGLSLGAEQAAIFKPKKGVESQTTAKPTAINVLLVGDNDIGSLNSELYARYWFSDRLGLRAGLNYQFVEYTTNKKLAYDNDRFRGKLAQPFLGISFKL